MIHHEQIIVHEPLIIRDAPPPLRTEIITVTPSPQYAWMPGYWIWRDGDWIWRSGYWESRPYPDAEWVPGEWVATTGGWFWRNGHWK